jgi:four helix bundle protein
MSRDHRKLKVFALADAAAIAVYASTRAMPVSERFGLQSQLRRAAVSVPANIVEGSTRESTRDYVHFLAIALGSASEARYLAGLAHRLTFIPAPDAVALDSQYDTLIRGLSALIRALKPRR